MTARGEGKTCRAQLTTPRTAGWVARGRDAARCDASCGEAVGAAGTRQRRCDGRSGMERTTAAGHVLTGREGRV